MTDADISDLVNSLKSLEEINISANGPIDLTEASVFKLINLCPRFVLMIDFDGFMKVSSVVRSILRILFVTQVDKDWGYLLLVGQRLGHAP